MRFRAIKGTLEERFTGMYIPEPNTGCWLWLAFVGSNGYGHMGVGGKHIAAHRMAWTLYRGPIPAGMCIDHVCRERTCVNPDHLRVATARMNAVENSIGPIARHAAKKCCPKCGGAYERLQGGPRVGRRFCRPCINRSWMKMYDRKKAQISQPVRPL